MDKNIIIDGVNVKDCERRIGKNNFCRYFKRNCADNNYNCIWKKCLRLEQENKELLKYETYYLDKYIELKDSLEEIRDIIRADCKGFTAECDCDDDCTRYKIKDKINEVLGC